MSASTPYQILGEEGIRELCNAFYDVMDTDPAVADIRAMHAASLANMKTKLAEYLSGWMGGPQLYAEKYGSVCMTTPHKAFKIGPKARDQWLYCMDQALERVNASDELKQMLKVPMQRIADAIRNADDDEPAGGERSADVIASCR